MCYECVVEFAAGSVGNHTIDSTELASTSVGSSMGVTQASSPAWHSNFSPFADVPPVGSRTQLRCSVAPDGP